MEQRPARSRCFNVFFVFEYLIYSSTTLNIMDKLWRCQRVFEVFLQKLCISYRLYFYDKNEQDPWQVIRLLCE